MITSQNDLVAQVLVGLENVTGVIGNTVGCTTCHWSRLFVSRVSNTLFFVHFKFWKFSRCSSVLYPFPLDVLIKLSLCHAMEHANLPIVLSTQVESILNQFLLYNFLHY